MHNNLRNTAEHEQKETQVFVTIQQQQQVCIAYKHSHSKKITQKVMNRYQRINPKTNCYNEVKKKLPFSLFDSGR